jgi:Tol biopolymer transport system component
MALWFKSSPPEHRMEFTIPVEGEIASLAISPDGEMIAYVSPDENTGSGMLYLQQVGHNTAKRVEGSEGATFPFFSPNHEYVGFFAGGKLKKVSTSGGVPQILTKVTTARGGSWGAKDVIIYAPEAAGYLWRINADGTQNTPLTKSMVGEYEISHRFPVFLPDGDRFLFWAGNFDEAVGDQISGVYVSSLSADNKRLITLCRSSIGYTQGALLYGDAQNALLALPLDEKGHVTGQPRMVVPRIGHYPSTHWGAFSVSTNGILVYSLTAGTAQSQLTWYDRTGKELGRVGDVGIISNPNLSPDNSWVAFDVADLKTKNIDVWLENLATRGVTRFTFDASEETTGVWSRDGSTIAFRGSGQRRLNIKRTRGLEPERTIVKNVLSGDALPTAWTPAGNQVLAVDMPNSGGTDVVLYSMDGKKVPFIATPANETNGQISPDGKWVIYASNESGDWEIYGTSFPTPSGKVQISRGGGAEPRWRSDGKEIFYIGPNGVLMSVALNTEGTLLTGTPQPLFQVHGRAPASSTDIFTFDVAKDGKRFLVNRYIKPASLEPLNIVLNMNGN